MSLVPEKETINNLQYQTEIGPEDLYLPEDFLLLNSYFWNPSNPLHNKEVREKNPYKGTLGNLDWEDIAVIILKRSQIRKFPEGPAWWKGIEGFYHSHQTIIDGMIEAGWLRRLPKAGYALTEAAIERMNQKSLEIQED